LNGCCYRGGEKGEIKEQKNHPTNPNRASWGKKKRKRLQGESGEGRKSIFKKGPFDVKKEAGSGRHPSASHHRLDEKQGGRGRGVEDQKNIDYDTGLPSIHAESRVLRNHHSFRRRRTRGDGGDGGVVKKKKMDEKAIKEESMT